MSEQQRRANAKTFIDWWLAQIMAQHPLMPALGAGLVVKNELVYSGVRGVRKRGDNAAVQLDDRFHMGSISKPMTGYLVAVLRRQGLIRWDRTLGETWPELFADVKGGKGTVGGGAAGAAHYRDVDITDMMTHTSGFDTDPLTLPDSALAAIDPELDRQLRAKRKLRTQYALLDTPYAGWTSLGSAPPKKYSSSCIIVASMAEHLRNRSWEQLIQEQVFEPLGMHQTAFANVSTKTSVSDLWWHKVEGNGVKASAFPDEIATLKQFTNRPAGAISLSIGSWGQWAKALLASSDSAHMTRSVLDEYFHVPAGLDCSQGGMFGGNGRFQHNGLNGWNYALTMVDRNARCAALAATNIGYEGVSDGINHLCEEIDGVGQAWPAMEHLSESLALAELSCSSDSAAPGQSATLLVDTSFRTRWLAQRNDPTLTVTLASKQWLRGIALCQFAQARIQVFELDLQGAGVAAPVLTLKGAALDALCTREGGVIKLLFATPMRVKKLSLRIKSASAPPDLHRLMVMVYQGTTARTFDISTSGALWITDPQRRVLSTRGALTDATLGMDIDTLGVGAQVRRADGKLWVLSAAGKLWRGDSNAWVAIAGSPQLLRIAVDATNDWVWCVAADGSIRKYRGAAWSVHPGNGLAKDIAVHAGQAWVVGSDDRAYVSGDAGWSLIPNGPGPLRRIAVDRGSLKLWAVLTDGRIFSRLPGAIAWVEHPGNGRAAEIALHGSTPYVLDNSAGGLWRSNGAGWEAVQLLQPRG
ncbi:MAG: serine hydrolase [Rubrivivax sp.]|nr:serine hydrolase [Rubrivivax sp.]